MTAILADDIFNCILLNENDKIPNQISLKNVPRSTSTGSGNGLAPMMTQFIGAYMQH